MIVVGGEETRNKERTMVKGISRIYDTQSPTAWQRLPTLMLLYQCLILTLMSTPLALRHTLSLTLTGNFLPLRRWSINQRPTTNSYLVSRPMARPSTRSHISSNTSVGKRLLIQISLTTMFRTSADGSSSSGALSDEGI